MLVGPVRWGSGHVWAERIVLVTPRSNGEEISGRVRFIEGGKISVQVNR